VAKKTVRRFVDPSKVGTHRPTGSTETRVYAGMKDADWQCNSCNNGREIPATTKVCPDCGNPKDKSEGYHSPSTKRPFLTNQDMVERGIDRERQKDEICPFCGSNLTSKSEVCPNCNGNIENVYKTSRICPNCKRESNTRVCESCGVETVSKTNLSSPTTNRPAQTQKQKSSGLNPNLLYVGIGLIVVLFVVGLFMIFRPHDEIATVSANNWTCSAARQENQYNFYGDWTLPPGADLVNSYEKFHHNNQVEDGYKEVCEDKWEVVDSHEEPKTKLVCTPGEYIETIETCDEETNVCTYDDIYAPDTCEDVPDGSETVNDYGWVNRCEDKMQYKDVPVNQVWYEYNIWEWVQIDPVSTSNTDNVISCPVITETSTIRQSGNPIITCATSFVVGDKTYPYSPDCQLQFPYYNIGSSWLVTISGPSITNVQVVP